MKKKKIFYVLMFCFLFSFLITACKKETGTKEVKEDGAVEMDDGSGDEKKKLKETEFKMVENGTTSYKIVIPDEPSDMIQNASSELQNFLKEATGATLEIVADSQVESADSVISLGKTNVAKNLGVETTENEELGISGYLIKTVGNNVVIMDDVDGDGEGVLYGVYDFLEDAIGFTVYAADEIDFEKMETVPVYAYDAVVIPSFDERSLSYYELRMNEEYRHRMRLFDLYSTPKWALYGHSQVSKILPYTGEHPEWYCAGGYQLCWSAGDELETAFANRLIELIQENPEAVYFMLGQEDATKVCNCEKCQANISADKYGSYSGLQIVFLNHVIEKVEAWRQANAPERELRYVCFAYYFSLMPPVKQDTDGNTVAYHQDCIPSDKLYMLFAPIETDFSLTLEDTLNKRVSQAVEDWQKIAPGRLLVYEYDCNFSNYLLNFNNFEVVQKHYETYYNNDVSLMYSQGPVEVKIPCFSEMRIYVESQLMWDLEQDYDKLVNKFMKAYYKDAAEPMRKYYDYIRKIYEEYEQGGTGQIYASLDDVYTMKMVEKLDQYTEEALDAIEPLRNTDNELFSTLYYRIKKESISQLWLKLNKFNLYYTEEELNDITLEFYYLCEKCEIESYAEGKDIEDMFYGYILEE